ncbi:unnamed protein product [Discula destructiva]
MAKSTGTHNLLRTGLLMTIAAILGAFISTAFQARSTAVSIITTTPELESLQSLLSFTSETVRFVPNRTFASPASPETDKAWMELLGPSNGFIALENPQIYGLGPGRSIDGDKHQVYGVTMFHELHCLIMIRDIYYGLLQAVHPLRWSDADRASPWE